MLPTPRRASIRSTTGVRGVHYHRASDKYAVSIMVRGVRYSFGLHATVEEASTVAEAVYSGQIPLAKRTPVAVLHPSRPAPQWSNPLSEAELLRLRRLAGGLI
jgi:hypothetical protein